MINAVSELRGMDENRLWTGLIERDPALDGFVFYGLRTTGIYCRPRCPARNPKRQNVRFYGSAEAAERAGFRACKRCHPRTAPREDPQAQLVRAASRDIESHLADDLSLEAVSGRIGCSAFHLQRSFKLLTGVTPRQYANAHRIEALKDGLRSGSDVTSALYDAGFGSSSVLYEGAAIELGMTPGTYGRAGEGTRISYSVRQTSLGALLVARTAKGFCAVRLGDKENELIAGLHQEFAAATISRDDADLGQTVDRIVAGLAGGEPRFDLPLDIRMTAFQRRVWKALRSIPAGETRTYNEIAKQIGQPTAARAVASACAANPVAVVIPCHRVVRSDGGLGGYRWGIERKASLLAAERREGAATAAAD